MGTQLEGCLWQSQVREDGFLIRDLHCHLLQISGFKVTDCWHEVLTVHQKLDTAGHAPEAFHSQNTV